MALLIALLLLLAQAPDVPPIRTRPADIAFRVQMVDPGASESVAVADFNKDGRLDILSAEHWYEAPNWTKHKIRDIPFTNGYVDNFTDLPVDVDGDGYTDIIQIAYFDRRIVWVKNPGRTRAAWRVTEIDPVGPTEFAFLVDLNNDGRAIEILPQFTGAAKSPVAWYELVDGKWSKHVVSSRGYGHGIGAGDVNGDGRNDIITPAGWLEAPADVRAAGEWAFHATDWAADAATAAAPSPQPPPERFDPALPFRRLPREEAIKSGFVVEYAPGTFDLRGGAAMGPDGVVLVNERALFQSQAAPPVSRPAEYGFMHVVDINKDGRSDILTTMAHSYGVLWFEQGANGVWTRRLIDSTWANAHASALADMNGDGQLDLVAAKRYFGRGGNDPSEREPMGIYWYQYRPGPKGTVEWIRHVVDYGGRAGGGLQMVVEDIDGDGDRDVITAGKTGLFLAENLSKSVSASRLP